MHTEENPYAAPAESERLSSPEDSSGQLPITRRGKRFLNNIIDTICYFVLAVVVEVMLLSVGTELTDLQGYAVGYLILFVYYFMWELVLGKTPGKFLTGTRVVTFTGERPTGGHIFKRSLARFIPFEAFSFFGGKGYPIGLHDSLSGTCVIDDR